MSNIDNIIPTSIDIHAHPEDGTTTWFEIDGETFGVNLNRTTGEKSFLDSDGGEIIESNYHCVGLGNWRVRDAMLGAVQLDADACPGCGCRPGDGITKGCHDPIGCGMAVAS